MENSDTPEEEVTEESLEENSGEDSVAEEGSPTAKMEEQVAKAHTALEEENGVHEKKGKKKQRKGKFASDKPTISEIRRLKKPNTRKCTILLDSSLAHEIGELEAEIEAMGKFQNTQRTSLADSTNKDIEALLENLDNLREEAESLTVIFTFQDIGRRNYDDLVTAHKPTDEEKQEYKEAGGEGVLAYSTLTFPPALVHETVIEPKIPIDEATEIFEDWAEGDIELLFTTALMVCKEPTTLPKSKAGIAKMRASQQKLTTALNEDSPIPNSSTGL